MIRDYNLDHKVALMQDGENFFYKDLDEVDLEAVQKNAPPSAGYLRQMHYIASHETVGLTIAVGEVFLGTWVNHMDYQLEKIRRR